MAGFVEAFESDEGKIRRIMSVIYSRAQKYGLLPRSESSNPVRWVEQSAKSSYKPIVVDPATAAKIFQSLSGMEQTLVILVATTGVRIGEAMGLKWDIDYQNKQINLRRVWVKDTIVERLKTDDSEAPVPLTDLLADCLRNWYRGTMYGRPKDWIFASTRINGRKPRSSSVSPERKRSNKVARKCEKRRQATFYRRELNGQTSQVLVSY